MERETTKIARDKIIESYQKIISNINSGQGNIIMNSGATINAGKSLRKVDIYNLIAEDTAMGYSEKMIEKYVQQFANSK
jgi:hypothetical protein